MHITFLFFLIVYALLELKELFFAIFVKSIERFILLHPVHEAS